MLGIFLKIGDRKMNYLLSVCLKFVVIFCGEELKLLPVGVGVRKKVSNTKEGRSSFAFMCSAGDQKSAFSQSLNCF